MQVFLLCFTFSKLSIFCNITHYSESSRETEPTGYIQINRNRFIGRDRCTLIQKVVSPTGGCLQAREAGKLMVWLQSKPVGLGTREASQCMSQSKPIGQRTRSAIVQEPGKWDVPGSSREQTHCVHLFVLFKPSTDLRMHTGEDGLCYSDY